MTTTFWRLRSHEYAQAVHRKVPHGAYRAIALILFLESLSAGRALAQSEGPVALVPQNFSWQSLPATRLWSQRGSLAMATNRDRTS